MRGVLKPREERIANDAYFTPQPLADEICRRLADVFEEERATSTSRIWDPCCGGGAFSVAAKKAWPSATVLATDYSVNFLVGVSSPGQDLIVSNPPYLLAERFVYRALDFVPCLGRVVFLLRLSFLAGQRRLALYEQHPLRYLVPITPRPSFTPDGKTDASEYGVFVWERGYTGLPEILPHIRWKR